LKGVKEMSIEFYNVNAIEFFNNTVSADMTETYEEFLQHVKPEGKILDAGCGSGRDSVFFLSKGFEVVSLDASDEMVRLSSEFTGQKTIKLRFQDIEFIEEFDGVWACASLLHVSRDEIDDVVSRIVSSLRAEGVFYASFKYGNEVVTRDDRLFNSYNEESITGLLEKHDGVAMIRVWKTQDVRVGREDEFWINVLCKRV
jgi:cyclopropane fatty-acyl-phospholipid synthase-like methyltransferase